MADNSSATTKTSSRKTHVTSQLEEGIAMARQGDRASARAIFRRIIHSNPHQEDAWLWLAWVAEDGAHSLAYLREAQALLPRSERLAEAVAWAQRQPNGDQEAAGAPAQAERRGGPAPTRASSTPSVKAPGTADISRGAGGQTWPQRNSSEGRTSGQRADIGTRADTVVGKASQMLQGVAQGAGRISQNVQGHLAKPQTGKERWDQVQQAVLPVFSVLALGVLALFAGAAIFGARGRSNPVRAWTLPTPVAVTTPVSVQQRIGSLWTQIDVAWEQQDWDAAAAAIEHLRELDPGDEEARRRLAQVHYQRGLRLVAASKLGEAQEEFDQAIRLDAANEALQDERNRIRLYLTGLEAYNAKDAEQVIEKLEPLYESNPNFRDTRTMLGRAHYDVAVSYQEKGEWETARDHYKSALLCLPDMLEAQTSLAEVEALITPPRRVVVDLSEQMATVYENNQPIHIFTVCTGRATAPTVPGRYEVLDKMPMAYASTWDLDMPWWIGIYWAGGSENGFHALPSRHNGRQVLWGNSLGRPCSFGCIVLDTEDAMTLYDWIEVGTVVFVNP